MIGKVLRDFKPANLSFELDAMEWIAEAIEYIGHHAGFVPKTETLYVTSNRALLPCDYYMIRPQGALYNGVPLPYGHNGGYYEPDEAPSYVSRVVSNDGGPNYSVPVVSSSRGGEYYMLNGGYVVTSFEEGELEFKYWAFPLGEDGYPFIPDTVYYKEALEWYILKKLIMGGYQHPIFNYDYADSKWKQYCAAAANDIAFPTPDRMDQFISNWVRMIPIQNPVSDNFSRTDLT